MTRDEWQRVKAIVSEALARPEAERAAFLDEICSRDPVVGAEARSLLAASVAAEPHYETPLVGEGDLLDAVRAIDEWSMVGRRIGAYRVVAEIGQGGMGAAYLAERADEAFEKRVVIKLIKRGMDTEAILRRFRHERQILANLGHPNIATLLDGGTAGDGRPYFVMEHIDGLPIDVYCDTHRLPIGERLRLFRTVCEAVQYAHEMRVIHRDLKPTNILVTQKGVPKLLDFGIAKVLDPESGRALTEETLLTGAMTPMYASPEQIRRGAITPASDVYSLGVLLFLLLTGRHPHVAGERSRQEIEEAVCQDPPTRPSAIVDAEAGRLRSNTPEQLRRHLSGSLDTIALTALQKDPGRRYASARALADDVGRYLEGERIAARPDGLGARLRRLAGTRTVRGADRHRGAAGARRIAAAVVLFAVASTAALLLDRRGRETATPSDAPPFESIAVLPLVNTGGDPELDYLSDGLTEHLIARLSATPRLRVIARDSVFRYRDRAGDALAVGRELNVGAVLTGTMSHRGNDLAVSAELRDVRDGGRIWSRRYERRLTDLQLLQTELADDIAGGLRLQIAGGARARYTHSADAYQLYLKGRYFWNRRTPDDLRKSVEQFRQATEADPQFALAWAGLSDSNGLLTEYHVVPARETYAEAKQAAERALALDPSLGEAHTSLAYVRHFYEWDFAGAETAYLKAIDLNPQYPTAHQWYAEHLTSQGRLDEALVEIRRARDLDPVSLIVNAVEANILYMARRYDESIEQCRRVIDLDPNFQEVYTYLKRAYDQKGLYAEAIEARQMRRRLLGRDARPTPALVAARRATSARVYWRSRVVQELAEARTEGLEPLEFAGLLAQAGDIPGALEWLDRACDASDFAMLYARVVPDLDPLRGNPAFEKILQRRCAVAGM